MNKIIGASLFSSAGIAEMYFKEIGIEIRTSNELIKRRAELYSYFYPESNMINGDITDIQIYNEIKKSIKETNAKFLIATPPCQGMSSLGKKDYNDDIRNYLIFYVLDIIDNHDFDYIFIENVPKFLKLYFPYKNDFKTLEEILIDKYSKQFNIKIDIYNAENYGVSQSRPRAIIRIYKKELFWNDPIQQEIISLKESIGHLPSLESEEKSDIKWHFAKKHNEREILAMRHTAEGNSAMNNEFYYPRKVNGEKIKGFHNTYKRMKWSSPAPARVINSGSMGGHNNVHPGRLNKDGTYSDARVLTLKELFIVSSLPEDMDFPEGTSDNFIRTVIGEAIPPLFSKNIVKGIHKDVKYK